MRKHLIILLFPLAFIHTSSKGQLSHQEPKDLSFGLSISTNYHHVRVTDLNTLLKKNGLKEIKTGYINLGAGLNLKYDRHFLQFSGDFDVNETAQYNENNVGTSGYGYAVNIHYGYDIGLLREIKLVPYLGVSRAIFETTITDEAQPNFDFQAKLSERNSISVDNDAFSINPGLRILMPIGDSEFSYCGVDVNYGFNTNSKWTINDSKVSGGPTINPSGLKIGIVLMFMICK